VVVDRERLLQVAGSLARFAVLEMAAADSFQRACFRHRQADASGNGERLGVVVPGLAGGRRAGGQLAEAVECFGLADAVAQFPVHGEGLGVAGEGGTRLPPRYQRLITLLTHDPPTPYAQISATLGIPVGSIGPMRSRCLQQLRSDPVITALINADAVTAVASDKPFADGRISAD
jgi:hypothetical protein